MDEKEPGAYALMLPGHLTETGYSYFWSGRKCVRERHNAQRFATAAEARVELERISSPLFAAKWIIVDIYKID
jgi:hypothetical protein